MRDDIEMNSGEDDKCPRSCCNMDGNLTTDGEQTAKKSEKSNSAAAAKESGHFSHQPRQPSVQEPKDNELKNGEATTDKCEDLGESTIDGKPMTKKAKKSNSATGAKELGDSSGQPRQPCLQESRDSKPTTIEGKATMFKSKESGVFSEALTSTSSFTPLKPVAIVKPSVSDMWWASSFPWKELEWKAVSSVIESVDFSEGARQVLLKKEDLLLLADRKFGYYYRSDFQLHKCYLEKRQGFVNSVVKELKEKGMMVDFTTGCCKEVYTVYRKTL